MCKIYMARKIRLIVISPSFENKMAVLSYVKGMILLKRPYISLIIAATGSKCKNNLKEVNPFSNCRLLPLTPSSMSSGITLLQRPYISFSSPLLLILRRDITVAAVALLFDLL